MYYFFSSYFTRRSLTNIIICISLFQGSVQFFMKEVRIFPLCPPDIFDLKNNMHYDYIIWNVDYTIFSSNRHNTIINPAIFSCQKNSFFNHYSQQRILWFPFCSHYLLRNNELFFE